MSDRNLHEYFASRHHRQLKLAHVITHRKQGKV